MSDNEYYKLIRKLGYLLVSYSLLKILGKTTAIILERLHTEYNFAKRHDYINNGYFGIDIDELSCSLGLSRNKVIISLSKLMEYELIQVLQINDIPMVYINQERIIQFVKESEKENNYDDWDNGLKSIQYNAYKELDTYIEEYERNELNLVKSNDIGVEATGTFDKQTEDENTLTKAKQKRKNEIFDLIEQDFTGDLQAIIHDYFDFLIQCGRPIYKANDRAMLRILDELSGGDDKKKEAIVNQSLARGWQGFYALKDNSNTQKTWKNVQPVLAHQDEDEPEIKEFRDENGNLITFG